LRKLYNEVLPLMVSGIVSLSPEDVLAEFHRGIEVTPEVCGGAACIQSTRIPVWVLEEWRRLGKTESEILAFYPGLRASDLVNAWAYAAIHPTEIDERIRLNNMEETD
jgi:uncharacterized protein (DUF433 family)